MYPILMRLADPGLLETAWETDPPAGRGAGTARPGPPRRRPATATGGHTSTAGVLEALAGTEVRQ